MFLHQTGQLDAALAMRGNILARSQRALPHGHVNIAKCAWDRTETLAAMQRDDDCIVFAAEWLPHWQRLLGANDSRVTDARGWLAGAQQRQAR